MIERGTCLTAAALTILYPSGCQSSDTDGEIEIRPAPIHEVRVNVAESYPPQVFVYIQGGPSRLG